MKVDFKEYNDSQEEALIAMMRTFYDGEGYPFVEKKVRESIHDIVNDPSLGEIIIIEKAKELVGYFILTLGYSFEYTGRYVLLDELFIKQSFRHMEIGSTALTFIEMRAKAYSATAIFLEVEKRNQSARKLYAKRGFELVDRQQLKKVL